MNRRSLIGAITGGVAAMFAGLRAHAIEPLPPPRRETRYSSISHRQSAEFAATLRSLADTIEKQGDCDGITNESAIAAFSKNARHIQELTDSAAAKEFPKLVFYIPIGRPQTLTTTRAGKTATVTHHRHVETYVCPQTTQAAIDVRLNHAMEYYWQQQEEDAE